MANGEWRFAVCDPLAQERGLAKAGRGRDECQFAAEACVQSLEQARALHPVRPGGGDVEFGRQEGGGQWISGQRF